MTSPGLVGGGRVAAFSVNSVRLTVAALAAVALSATWFYAVCALAAAASIAAALYGYLQEVRGHRIGWVFGVSYYFLSMNLALMFGLFRFLAGTQTSVWRRTARH